MELEFRTRNPKQYQAAKDWHDTETEQILYGGAKYGGKSYLGASLIFIDALTYPETQYFIARQELVDLSSFTLPTVREVFKNLNLEFNDYCSYNGQSHIFNLKNGSQVHLIACKPEPRDPFV
jgi:phage terminase large subunit